MKRPDFLDLAFSVPNFVVTRLVVEPRTYWLRVRRFLYTGVYGSPPQTRFWD